MSSFLARWAKAILERRVLAVLGYLAVLALVGGGATRLIVDFNTQDLFASGDPAL